MIENALVVLQRGDALAIAQQLGQLAPAGGGALRLLEVRDAEVDREAATPRVARSAARCPLPASPSPSIVSASRHAWRYCSAATR